MHFFFFFSFCFFCESIIWGAVSRNCPAATVLALRGTELFARLGLEMPSYP